MLNALATDAWGAAVEERPETFRRLVAGWGRERLGIRTIVVTVRDAVRTTRADPRSSATERRERVRGILEWATEALERHQVTTRRLDVLTDAAARSGTVTPREASILAQLADECAHGLHDASGELAAMGAVDLPVGRRASAQLMP